ncbi:SRPBCC family protein [Solirubrobacter sp. CPCC 204708]|uniref:SRPBCC family protein n=1 Tax=Solirubrobacter deserti TaxID=2282478 RepID=A0ABT4RMU5_9ACTN|nr:SRPBCC family protein [Solirubrobacter deserti]MBE2314983.1 SRPBCC family protein [Solirubrobacter deserti]MDA0139898.1 SRPBCC family protein [Solirubrobacter deserti]
MPNFSHSIEVSKPPSEVFPWLLEQDKVPQWTSDLERYDVDGPLGVGTRVTQKLTVAGGIALDMEITEYSPPSGAATAFETNGVKVTSAYILAENGGGTRLTQTLDAQASGFTAKMLIPIVQGRLEGKLKEDLERLKGLLEG